MNPEFTPHGFCLSWEPHLLWLTIVSNAAIALSYFAIPAALLMIRRFDRTLVPGWLAYLFAAFILLCGIGHVLDIVTLWKPLYWLQAGVLAATGIVSFFTAGTITLGARHVYQNIIEARRIEEAALSARRIMEICRDALPRARDRHGRFIKRRGL